MCIAFDGVIVVLLDCLFIENNAVAIDELNGFIYYGDTDTDIVTIIRRATFTGENITDILDLGRCRVCNMIFLLVLDQYCQLFKHLHTKVFVKVWLGFLM